MKPPSLFSRLAVAILIMSPCGSQSATVIPRIDLGYATYQGTRLAAGVDQYLGMRYAAPPTGDLRWRAPQDPAPLDAVQNATSVSTPLYEGCTCMQTWALKNRDLHSSDRFALVWTREVAAQGEKTVFLSVFSHPQMRRSLPNCPFGLTSLEAAT